MVSWFLWATWVVSEVTSLNTGPCLLCLPRSLGTAHPGVFHLRGRTETRLHNPVSFPLPPDHTLYHLGRNACKRWGSLIYLVTHPSIALDNWRAVSLHLLAFLNHLPWDPAVLLCCVFLCRCIKFEVVIISEGQRRDLE